MGACLNSKNQIMIVTEYAARFVIDYLQALTLHRGDLKHSLKDVNSIAKRVELVHDVATGLSWLQAHNIVHRDLKLDNLLVTDDWTIKITFVDLQTPSDCSSGILDYPSRWRVERRGIDLVATLNTLPLRF